MLKWKKYSWTNIWRMSVVGLAMLLIGFIIGCQTPFRQSAAEGATQSKIMPLGTGSSGEPKEKDDIRLLPYQMENGYKVFHLTAEPVWGR